MYAAFYLVVLAIVWSASDSGRTVEARGFGNCKAMVGAAMKIVNKVKRCKDSSPPICKCGRMISRIDVTDKDTKETTTMELCTGCPGKHVPMKNSNYCGNCRHRRFRNFSPFCKTALDKCNGKGVTIYTCKCQAGDGTTPVGVTDPPLETTIQVEQTTNQNQIGETTVPPVDWTDY